MSATVKLVALLVLALPLSGLAVPGLPLIGRAAAADRAPLAWALAVEGRVVRNDGTSLDAGEALEPGAQLTLPVGAVVTAAQNGRIVRWEGPSSVRVTPTAVRLSPAEGGGEVVRRPHIEPGPTMLAGDTQAPAGAAQWTSALGVPLNAGAWARQDAIDGGTLHALYRDALAGRLAEAGIDRALVTKMGVEDALPGNRSEQIALVGGYLDLAGATPGATVVFEVPPTFAPDLATGSAGGAVLRGIFAKPKTFRADRELDEARQYGLAVAGVLRARGSSVFALVVPYANTVENIIARDARPADGVENLHHLLVRAGGLEGSLRTLAVGYGQGAAVVREYLARYGDSDGLDYAVPLAAMGGADGEGADGVWSGRVGPLRADGVPVLSVVHASDPARRVHGGSLVALTPGLLHLAHEARPNGGDLPLLTRYHGYPTAYLATLIDDLLMGRHSGTWARRGDWAFDTRLELGPRLDPRVVADGYLPAPTVTTATRPD
ncbi:MAG: hypothetical protein Q8P18_15260 [Pseudomonadota bacterium]|nr:hypothetical protein [Pseudomonadota bacterium]